MFLSSRDKPSHGFDTCAEQPASPLESHASWFVYIAYHPSLTGHVQSHGEWLRRAFPIGIEESVNKLVRLVALHLPVNGFAWKSHLPPPSIRLPNTEPQTSSKHKLVINLATIAFRLPSSILHQTLPKLYSLELHPDFGLNQYCSHCPLNRKPSYQSYIIHQLLVTATTFGHQETIIKRPPSTHHQNHKLHRPRWTFHPDSQAKQYIKHVDHLLRNVLRRRGANDGIDSQRGCLRFNGLLLVQSGHSQGISHSLFVHPCPGSDRFCRFPFQQLTSRRQQASLALGHAHGFHTVILHLHLLFHGVQPIPQGLEAGAGGRYCWRAPAPVRSRSP